MISIEEQIILDTAVKISQRESKKKKEEFKKSEHEWCRSKIGKFFRERVSGASDDAFSVFRVKDFGMHDYIELENVGYWHDGHHFIGRDTWSPDKNVTYMEEISEKEYYTWMEFYLFKIHAKVPTNIMAWHRPKYRSIFLA